jgi:hypothetical protein
LAVGPEPKQEMAGRKRGFIDGPMQPGEAAAHLTGANSTVNVRFVDRDDLGGHRSRVRHSPAEWRIAALSGAAPVRAA